ncbi:hypothetical protein DL767_008679 [Monosporascus sp. MG133]|nr:hypothetical protein DL767_008679 [Monosporascus sp. MG133]
MRRIVRDGLKKTEKEAAVKHDIQEKMHAISSVKELIDAAVKLVPEAAITWTGTYFALQSIKVAENTIRQDSDQYNTQEIKSRLGELVRNTESLAANLLPGIRQALQEMRQEKKNEKQEKKNKECLADLHRTDPRDNKKRIKQTKGGLLKDSSNWILKHEDFQRWHNNDKTRLL